MPVLHPEPAVAGRHLIPIEEDHAAAVAEGAQRVVDPAEERAMPGFAVGVCGAPCGIGRLGEVVEDDGGARLRAEDGHVIGQGGQDGVDLVGDRREVGGVEEAL